MFSPQVNNTLAPYKTCPNDSNPAIGDRGTYYVKQWVGVYLLQAHMRIQPLSEGVHLTLEDVCAIQMMCAYEVRNPLHLSTPATATPYSLMLITTSTRPPHSDTPDSAHYSLKR